MTAVIESIASSEFPAAADANMVAFWAPYGRVTKGEMEPGPGTRWFCTGIRHPLFNGVVRAEFDRQEVEPMVRRLATEIGSGGASALWWVGPLATPGDIGRTLESLGLAPSGDVPGMAIGLASLDEEPAVKGLDIRLAEDRSARIAWARTAASGNEFPSETADALVALEAEIDERQYCGQLRYIGYLDGKPVATSVLVLHAGLAGIYAVATVPFARRHGIGRAMTALPLLEARRRGYAVAILQASTKGRPVYWRMGFREFCSYRTYLQS